MMELMSETTQAEQVAAAPVKVDIWSDVQCGWCYIAKRRLEAAVERFGGEIEIEYHSFELAPEAPVEFDGATKEFLNHYRGVPIPEAERMLARVTSIAAGAGLDYHFDRTHPTNTIIAHELIHFAKSKGRQPEMNERLSDAYFQRGEHIGRIPNLVEIAGELGFDRDEVETALTEHRFLADVKADFAKATELGIQGIPFFVFDGRYGLSGAQDEGAFLQVLRQVVDERGAVPGLKAEAR
jgi:predicted DsbA family dithiol-disulfide isomerase